MFVDYVCTLEKKINSIILFPVSRWSLFILFYINIKLSKTEFCSRVLATISIVVNINNINTCIICLATKK